MCNKFPFKIYALHIFILVTNSNILSHLNAILCTLLVLFCHSNVYLLQYIGIRYSCKVWNCSVVAKQRFCRGELFCEQAAELLFASVPQMHKCIYSIMYIHKVYILCAYIHTPTPGICWTVMFEAYVFIFSYVFHWAGEDLCYRKVKGFASQMSMEDWIMKARPPESLGAYLSHIIILPPKYMFSPLTTGRTRGCFLNMAFPHRGPQAVAVCQSSMEKNDTQYLFVTLLYCGKGPLIGRKERVHPLRAGGLPKLSRATRTPVQSIFSCLLGSSEVQCT